MKRIYILSITACCLIALGNFTASGKKNKKNEKQETTAVNTEPIGNTQFEEETAIQTPPEGGELKTELSSQDNIIQDLKGKIDAKDTEISNLKKELDSNKKEFSNRIAADSIKMEEYEKKIISLCSYLFYIPYYQVCIDEVAIPAFETLKGTELYDKYQVRLKLLKNYRRDLQELIDFLKPYKIDRAENHVIDAPVWRSSVAKKFGALNVVKSYKTFDYWQQTYLGHYILQIQALLYDGTAQKIDSTFAEILSTLENDLKNGSK